LIQGIGLWQATALNVTFIVGAGVFATIPAMVDLLPGPYALLAWAGAGVLILLDGLVWSELGAAMPRSGGTYHFLLECYGRDRWGRLMAFLFLWQFTVSGPLELGFNLAAIALFAPGLSPAFADFDRAHSVTWGQQVSVGPARLFASALGLVILGLLYRRVTTLGRVTVVLWVGLLAAVGWILVEGALRFQPGTFDFRGATNPPSDLGGRLGPALMLAIFASLGYYNICHVGEEVREPARVIPRAILSSVAIVIVLFVGLHLALLGVVSWKEIPEKPDDYNLPAEFMRRLHGDGAAALISVLLIGCCHPAVRRGRVPGVVGQDGELAVWEESRCAPLTRTSSSG
jgi:amino acid transporter